MSKAKIIIAAITVTSAISVIGSNAALAVPSGWQVGGEGPLKGTAALAPTAIVEKLIVLKFNVIKVECFGTTLNGIGAVIASSNKGSALSLEFTSCKASTGSKCTLSDEKINTGPVSVEVTLSGTFGVRGTFRPKTGTLFTTLLFSGATCALSEEVQPVTGQATAYSSTGQSEFPEHELVATASALTVGTSPATLTGGAELKLASGAVWSFI